MLEWSKKYDPEFANILEKYKEESMAIYNIEREQKKPRKDYAYYSEIKEKTWYMYDEYFKDISYDFSAYDREEVKKILNTYIQEYYSEFDTEENWFNKIKELCEKENYAINMKAYKEDSSKFRGSVVDVTNMIRIALTTLKTTPNLYALMQILGAERVNDRIQKITQ